MSCGQGALCSLGDCSSEPFLHIFPFQGVEGGRAQNRARCDCWPVAVLCDSCQSLDGALEHLRRTFRLSHNGASLFVWAAAARFFSLNPDSDPYQWLQLTYHFCTLCRTDKRMLSEMCTHMVFLFRLRLPHFTRLKFIRYACILGLIKSRHSQLKYVSIPTAFKTFAFSSVDH